MQDTQIAFRSELPPLVVLLVGVVLVVLAVRAYARTTRPISHRLRFLLLALRLTAIGVLLICLLRPAMETTTYTLEKQSLLILQDHSRSMTEIRDAPGDRSRLEAIRRVMEENRSGVAKLREKYDLRILPFARGLISSETPGEYARSYSAYGRVLEEALTGVGSGDCGGIVLMGDGSHNLGPPDPMDVAALLADRRIPLYTVGVGQEVPGRKIRDVEIMRLEAPRTAYVFTSFAVRARVLLRGCRDETVKLRLAFPDHGFQFREVTPHSNEEIVTVQFQATAQKVGQFKLTVRANELEEELFAANNTRSTFVRVVKSGLRVGVFDSLRPEGKFVYQVLTEAPQVSTRRILLGPDERVSDKQADWESYDVVAVGDLPATAFSGEQLKALQEAVNEGGKGLILLAGPRSMGSSGFGDTFLEEVLPANLPGSWTPLPAPRDLSVNANFSGHPILSLENADRDASWEKLPSLGAVAGGAVPKRGAQVLATDQDENPILCIQRVGAGRSACVLTNTTYRWFFTPRETQDVFRLFWRQLVLWVSGMEDQPEDRFWIAPSKTQVGVGEPVIIQSHLITGGGTPVRDARIVLEVRTPEEEVQTLDSQFSRDQGHFQAAYTPTVPGEYTVHGRALRRDKEVGKDAAFFQAFRADRELQDPVADLSLLRRLSALTSEAGGDYYPAGRLNRLLDRLIERGEPLRLTTSRYRELWDTAWTFLVFVLALMTEWGVRKWKGLA